ncbi:MAG: HD-like signal output (HDOD) protein [Myxococcota bacterium]
MADERLQSVGRMDSGEISLACQSEVIELAKLLSTQESSLRPFLETMVSELEQNRIELPTLPATASRVLDLAASSDIELSDLTAVVELDVSLTAKIVGIGNTAFFARAGGPVASVHEALMRMGTRRAFDVVLMTALRAKLVPAGALHAYAVDLWAESLRAALTCQHLLAERPPFEKSGFLLGLLHGIGRWAVLGFATSLSQRGWHDRSLRREIIDSVGDALEGPLGGLVVDSWSYSPDFCLAIRNYARPAECEGDAFELANALHLATVIARKFESGWLPDPEAPDTALLAKLERLGVDAERLGQIATEVGESFEALSKIN